MGFSINRFIKGIKSNLPDAYVLTYNECEAIIGTSGTPSSTNKFVTDADSRNSNAREPTQHTMTSSLHGFPGGATYLKADGTWGTPAGGAIENNITLVSLGSAITI